MNYQQLQQQRLLVELDETMNYSPLKHVKHLTTTTTATNAKASHEATRLHRSNGNKTSCDDQNKQKLFKFKVIL